SGRPGLVFDIGGKTSLLLLPLFVALFQTVADGQVPSRAARPVRVWLGSRGVLTRGTPVRVYVQAAQDGNLIVLHRRTDGRIEVLFPGKPNEDPFVRAGTYEIQATPTRVAFVVAEPDGSGLVLAALTPRAYRFDEFVRAALWDPFFSPCIGDGRFHHRGQRPGEERAAAPSRTVALSMRGSSATAVIPRDGRAGGGTGFARKTPTAGTPPIEPRARAPLVLPREQASLPIRAVPLGPGQAVPARRRIVSAPAAPAPGRVVSLTLTPTRVREEPAGAPRSSGSLVLTGLTVSPPPQPAPSSRTVGLRREVLGVQESAPVMVRGRGLAVAGSGSRTGGEAAAPATGRTQGIALPPAVFHGAH